ncbi:uncharacterized protein zgc:174945 [Alosa alosa]|uniref:uncharacterized protein zgc:174945 n=1 Tax=Alosa sapidissima TaxID=34773 RepID=UPI001C07F861|nr:uncharacterized protein zgc:174945 [Alosa sapidissima]XP_048111745.1 uncharacterized protein zgc:174945 [Alosa alosa]
MVVGLHASTDILKQASLTSSREIKMWSIDQALGLINIVTLVCQLPLTLQASAVDVQYPKKELKLIEGDTMKLNCTVVYQPENCTELTVNWYRRSDSGECQILSEPDRQLISMNETEHHNVRNRDVMFEMWNISAKDAGLFQCRASCGSSNAMGHLVTLIIDQSSAGRTPKAASRCGTNRADIVLLVATAAALYLWLECQIVS